jgi:hypothetical protein
MGFACGPRRTLEVARLHVVFKSSFHAAQICNSLLQGVEALEGEDLPLKFRRSGECVGEEVLPGNILTQATH